MPGERRTGRLTTAALAGAFVLVATATASAAPEDDPAEPLQPAEATPSPADPLAPVILIPEHDNRTGGDHPSEWRPRRTVSTSTADLVAIVSFGAIGVGAAVTRPQPRHTRGGVLVDEEARDALRLRDIDHRYQVRDMSDVGVSLLSTWPFLVDALVTAWWHRGDVKLARNMALVSAEALMLTAAIQGVTNTAVSRERPYGRLCGGELPDRGLDCEGNVRYRSFFSGHSAISFTAAGVLCVHHVGLRLLGPPWDALTCASGATVAGVTALFRVMADMHYVSDVAVGAVVGTSVGLLVPWLHLGGPPRDAEVGRLQVRFAPVGQGLGLTGTF